MRACTLSEVREDEHAPPGAQLFLNIAPTLMVALGAWRHSTEISAEPKNEKYGKRHIKHLLQRCRSYFSRGTPRFKVIKPAPPVTTRASEQLLFSPITQLARREKNPHVGLGIMRVMLGFGGDSELRDYFQTMTELWEDIIEENKVKQLDSDANNLARICLGVEGNESTLVRAFLRHRILDFWHKVYQRVKGSAKDADSLVSLSDTLQTTSGLKGPECRNIVQFYLGCLLYTAYRKLTDDEANAQSEENICAEIRHLVDDKKFTPASADVEFLRQYPSLDPSIDGLKTIMENLQSALPSSESPTQQRH